MSEKRRLLDSDTDLSDTDQATERTSLMDAHIGESLPRHFDRGAMGGVDGGGSGSRQRNKPAKARNSDGQSHGYGVNVKLHI